MVTLKSLFCLITHRGFIKNNVLMICDMIGLKVTESLRKHSSPLPNDISVTHTFFSEELLCIMMNMMSCWDGKIFSWLFLLASANVQNQVQPHTRWYDKMSFTTIVLFTQRVQVLEMLLYIAYILWMWIQLALLFSYFLLSCQWWIIACD